MEEESSTNEENKYEGTMELVQYMNDERRREILRIPDIKNKDCCSTIIKIAKLVKNVYDKLERNDPELIAFKKDLSRLSNRLPKEIDKNIGAWMIKRQYLLQTLQSSADKLDTSIFWATVGRLFGSSLDLLHNVDSISENKISSCFIELAEGVSPKLGFITKIFSLALPYLTYVGLTASFVDVFNSRWVVGNILKIMKEDRDCFEKIQNWLDNAGKVDEEIKKLLPFTIDSDLPDNIQKAFPECDNYIKMFALLCVAGLEKGILSISDLESSENRYMKIIHTLSKSNFADEWINRCLKIDHRLVIDIMEFRNRNLLMNLASSQPNPDAVMEVGGQVMKMKIVPHLVQGLRNCIFSYYSAKELMEGVKHKNSDMIRYLKKKAEYDYHLMIEFKTKLESP